MLKIWSHDPLVVLRIAHNLFYCSEWSEYFPQCPVSTVHLNHGSRKWRESPPESPLSVWPVNPRIWLLTGPTGNSNPCDTQKLPKIRHIVGLLLNIKICKLRSWMIFKTSRSSKNYSDISEVKDEKRPEHLNPTLWNQVVSIIVSLFLLPHCMKTCRMRQKWPGQTTNKPPLARLNDLGLTDGDMPKWGKETGSLSGLPELPWLCVSFCGLPSVEEMLAL